MVERRAGCLVTQPHETRNSLLMGDTRWSVTLPIGTPPTAPHSHTQVGATRPHEIGVFLEAVREGSFPSEVRLPLGPLARWFEVLSAARSCKVAENVGDLLRLVVRGSD